MRVIWEDNYDVTRAPRLSFHWGPPYPYNGILHLSVSDQSVAQLWPRIIVQRNRAGAFRGMIVWILNLSILWQVAGK